MVQDWMKYVLLMVFGVCVRCACYLRIKLGSHEFILRTQPTNMLYAFDLYFGEERSQTTSSLRIFPLEQTPPDVWHRQRFSHQKAAKIRCGDMDFAFLISLRMHGVFRHALRLYRPTRQSKCNTTTTKTSKKWRNKIPHLFLVHS